MIGHRVLAAAVALSVLGAPTVPTAEPEQPLRQAQAQKSKVQDRVQSAQPKLDVEELTPGQIQRAQEPDQPPAPPRSQPSQQAQPKPAAKPTEQTPPRIVACSGMFGRDSSHAKLATVYTGQNIAFTDVDGPGGTAVMATVLFPKNPRGRLEVWWQDQPARAGTHLMVISGQSSWTAPKGMKLRLPLAAIEKINGQPFSLSAFGKEGSQVTDWKGGALAQLPGGCKVGVRLMPDPSTPAPALSAVASGREFTSADPNVRALKPTIAEIILGY